MIILKRIVFVFGFILIFCGTSLAVPLTKDFTFKLGQGETSQDWEENISLPSDANGKFIGRQFITIVDNTATELIIEKENLADNNYYIKGKLLAVPEKNTLLSHQGKLHIQLYIGAETLKDVYLLPSVVTCSRAKFIKVQLQTFSEATNQEKPFYGINKYFSYLLKENSSDVILAEGVVSSPSPEAKFSINYPIKQDVDYIVEVKVSGLSGQYSQPMSFKVPSQINASRGN
ncbi:MAG: hypothetical protein HQM08_22335 [Candidatus Riflebacteria bacterium]|nr:hypothetical protein [Candidatus Riflebacteria bacterium]